MSTEGRESPCTTCGAKAGEPCRTRVTGRVTDVHKARWLPIITRRAEAIRAESPSEDPYALRRGEKQSQ